MILLNWWINIVIPIVEHKYSPWNSESNSNLFDLWNWSESSFETLGNEVYQKLWNGKNWYWHTVPQHWIIKIRFLSIVVDDLRPMVFISISNSQFANIYSWNNRISHSSMHLIWFNVNWLCSHSTHFSSTQLNTLLQSFSFEMLISIRFLLGKSIILFFEHFFADEPNINFFL